MDLLSLVAVEFKEFSGYINSAICLNLHIVFHLEAVIFFLYSQSTAYGRNEIENSSLSLFAVHNLSVYFVKTDFASLWILMILTRFGKSSL